MKKEGYYIADVFQCTVIVYWDGYHFYSIGKKEPLCPKTIFAIDSEPLDLSSISDYKVLSIEDWLKGE